MAKVDHERNLGYCCNCLPLKFGVVLCAALIGMTSLIALISSVTEDARILVGGYNRMTNFVVTFMGAFGVVLSLGCLIGVNENNASWIRPFAYFAILRALVVATSLLVDLSMFADCEEYEIGGSRFAADTYNVPLLTVAASGTCKSTRSKYLYLSLVSIAVSLTGAYNASRWADVIDYCTGYTISLDPTTGGYYSTA
eukprot:TRINITY_DN45297_c0_g1_i1.p1 TRINITY_DN45297_c0_g1~~TRINITY_DN45297_c0_g1_i1.p1  ORF type:complete len:197 (-),score=18.94 TRINITY_DN45297_c0_g1_i1:86-676(-)